MIHDSAIGKLVAPVQWATLGVLVLFVPLAYGASGSSQFDKEWAKLIAAAQQEGRVVIAAGGAPSREYRSVAELFQKKFGIPVSLSTGSGAASVGSRGARRRRAARAGMFELRHVCGLCGSRTAIQAGGLEAGE